MHLDRIRMMGLLLAGSLVLAASPASALGHKGDSRQITTLRDAHKDSKTAVVPSSDAAPEIDAGVAVSAIALVAGGILILRARRR
jgi:hypothetical protein